MSNSINKAELIGVASALRAMCTHIAIGTACSLYQIRKQLLYAELHRKYTHVKYFSTSDWCCSKKCAALRAGLHITVLRSPCRSVAIATAIDVTASQGSWHLLSIKAFL